MANDLHEALARFDAMPDDAILPTRITQSSSACPSGPSDTIQICRECESRCNGTVSECGIFANSPARECRFLMGGRHDREIP